MATAVPGIVKDGVVVPEAPLPEGARVEIHVLPERLEMPPEWQDDFDAWNRASAADQDAALRRAAADRLGHAEGEVRVIDAVLALRPHVQRLVAELPQQRHDAPLHLEPAMVAADRYLHGRARFSQG